MLFYYSSQDCTIKVWETTQGKLIRELKVSLIPFQLNFSSACLFFNMVFVMHDPCFGSGVTFFFIYFFDNIFSSDVATYWYFSISILKDFNVLF